MLRLRDLLAPPICLACRAPGFDLCPACRRALPWLEEPRCRRCGVPGCAGPRRGSTGGGPEARRRDCPAAAQAFAAAWAPVAYAGPVPALVHGLKQRRTRAAAGPMVAAMALVPPWLLASAPSRSRPSPPSAADLGRPSRRSAGPALVPVPTAATRARTRGFDQAALLASGLAARGVGTLVPALERVGTATRQRGSGRAERLAAGRIELRVRPGTAVPALCVLVDDVHTTGATFDACARVLLAAGAEHVSALAYARALP